MYHQAEPGRDRRLGGVEELTQDGAKGSPRPMNARVVSVKIAARR